MTASTSRNSWPGQQVSPSHGDRPDGGPLADQARLRYVGERYRLTAPIGRGAMGVVWCARDELLDRDVAVKEVRLPPSVSDAERRNGYQRTLREARTAARLSHPAVAAVYDVVEELGRPWIVMELVRGRSLDQVIAHDGPLSPEQAADVGGQLLAALAAAHAVGVLHRDVKPSNVLLSPDGRTVLTDFGIATVEGDPSLTQTGMVMGSPGFLAPERVRGGVATPASDLWSLGATLYAAVEGQGPYDRRGGAMTTMAAVVMEDPPPPRAAGPLAGVIGALLARDPAARPTAAAAARILEAARKGTRGDSTGSAASVAPASQVRDPGETARTPHGHARQSGHARQAALSRHRNRVIILAISGAAIFLAAAIATAQIHKAATPNPRGSPAMRSGGKSGHAGARRVSTRQRSGWLPAGFHWYVQPTGAAGIGTAGFRVAVPSGWHVTHNGMQTVFSEPGGTRFLALDLTPHHHVGMLAEALWNKRQTIRNGTFPGYQTYYIRPVAYQGTMAADWAFSWVSQTGGRTDVLDRFFVAQGQAESQSFALYWSTPAWQWQTSQPELDEILATFRPVW